MDKDIVRHILDIALQMAARAGGSFDESMALQIERQVRHDFGGDEVYINKRRPVSAEVKQEALREVKRTGRPQEVASKFGISRTAMYRMLKK